MTNNVRAYELVITYPDGSKDDYYRDFCAQYWLSTKTDPEEVLAEMRENDDTGVFEAIDSGRVEVLSLEVEPRQAKSYELYITYKNGETDAYYTRLTGRYWETAAQTEEEALEEMRQVDRDTFDDLDANESVAYYEVYETRRTR